MLKAIGMNYKDNDEKEILRLMKELCPDFAPYNYLKNGWGVTTLEDIPLVEKSFTDVTSAEGNGRTPRAFMNVQLVRAGLTPLYIKVEEKDLYLKALEKADTDIIYDPLYEGIFKVLIRSHVELSM